MEAILFYILATASVASAGIAITRAKPLTTVLWLVGCFVSMGGLMGLVGAPVVALLHILLTAGAIMVFYVFVIMLVDLDPSRPATRTLRFGKMLGAFIAAYLAAVTVLIVMRPPFEAAPAAPATFGNAFEIGRLLTGPFAIPFVLVSVLVVVAMVGAIVMAKRNA